MASLDALSRGFRTRYLDHDDLTAQLRAWADAYPHLARLRSLGRSTEGRDLWLLTIGPDPDRARPAVWVDGNMHAMELAGSNVALAIAESFLRLHVEGACAEAPPAAHDVLRGVLVHVLPRMSPDGAEAVLKSARYVRSSPRDLRPNQTHARWVSRDLDGDGLALRLRVVDPAGDFVESREVTGLMLPRTVDDEGPFYKLYPEGVIENFDGRHVPSWSYLQDNQDDFNRNFPYSWAPEEEQMGAGEFPGSTPETRAVLDFVARAPHLFAWLNLHTFGGVFIRPLGHQPDNKMDGGDLEVFRQIEEWAATHTGYPTVSGFEEFCYQPERPLRGDVSDYAYHQRGCIAFSVELWDWYKQLGFEKKKPFVHSYSHVTREQLVVIGRWDREHNRGRLLPPWRRVAHPQLGAVEVGGLDVRFGVWNPPEDKLDGVCRGVSAVFLRMAALVPRVKVEAAAVRVAPGVTRVDVTVRNEGYLSTYGLPSARKLQLSEALTVELVAGPGTRVVDEARKPVGHLEGWGRGRFGPGYALPYQASQAETVKGLSFFVEGQGVVTAKVGSCRVGFTERSVEV